MSSVIRIHSLISGEATEHDGRFLVHYDPWTSSGRYRITLETSDDISQARRFLDKGDAWECWRRQIGFRPDGKPDRPLTAWTVEIIDIEDQ